MPSTSVTKNKVPKKKIGRDDKRRPRKTNNIEQIKNRDVPKKVYNEICPGCDEVGRAEDWIQCNGCDLWWHEECTSYEGSGGFLCDLC